MRSVVFVVVRQWANHIEKQPKKTAIPNIFWRKMPLGNSYYILYSFFVYSVAVWEM